MMQRSVTVQEEAKVQPKSKTQELRDWLDSEIRRSESDICVLGYALGHPQHSADGRYANLTSDERAAKIANDQKKLEGIEKRLELLRSARELDVDIDAMEKLGVAVNKVASHEAILEGVFGNEPQDNRSFKFRFDLGRRTLTLTVCAKRDLVSSEHYHEGITKFSIKYGSWLSWHYSFPKEGKERELIICTHSGSGVYLVAKEQNAV